MMKLLNPTQRVVFLRDEVNRKLIVLKPGEMTNVLPTQREVFSKYVQGFQLRWILDTDDLPPHLREESGERQGTLDYYHKYEQGKEDSTTFDAVKALAQSDSQEIADLWKEHDTIRYIPHVSTNKPITPGSEEDFLFPKEDSTAQIQEGKIIQEISPLTDQEFDALLKGGESEEDFITSATSPTTIFEEERREDELLETEEGDEDTRLPHNAPITLNQLTMSTKAQIWEMLDKLGLDTSGTKKELIKKIVKYYQNAHYTNIHNVNNGGTSKT